MLAARDQENLVHGHQTAAASKPLNQGVKQLPPKTPGAKAPKTPFKLPLNDENAFGGGKSVLKAQQKGAENWMAGKKTTTGLDKDAFITPMGPRNRAPLGLKTTNAKAKNITTPAPPLTSQAPEKTIQKSATSRKLKPRISHTQEVKTGPLTEINDEDEPDIEYMPPKPKDLPDYPEDFPPDMTYPQFEGRNLTRGWYEVYCNPVEEDGRTRGERIWDEQQVKHDRAMDELLEREIQKMTFAPFGVPLDSEPSSKPEQRKKSNIADAKLQSTTSRRPFNPANGPNVATSKAAAKSLSQKPATTKSIPSVAAPQASKSRAPLGLLSNKKRTSVAEEPSYMRHTAATAASRTTLGYSRGRAVSNNIQRASILPAKPVIQRSDSQATVTQETANNGIHATVQKAAPTDEGCSTKTDMESEDEWREI